MVANTVADKFVQLYEEELKNEMVKNPKKEYADIYVYGRMHVCGERQFIVRVNNCDAVIATEILRPLSRWAIGKRFGLIFGRDNRKYIMEEANRSLKEFNIDLVNMSWNTTPQPNAF